MNHNIQTEVLQDFFGYQCSGTGSRFWFRQGFRDGIRYFSVVVAIRLPAVYKLTGIAQPTQRVCRAFPSCSVADGGLPKGLKAPQDLISLRHLLWLKVGCGGHL